jgi:hypothetical protein
MQKAPKLTPEEILFNGEENPLLRELAGIILFGNP